MSGSGGFLGAISRYAVTMLFTPLGNKELATLLVNIVGAVLLGGIMGMAQTKAVSPRIVLFFATGYLGALTTFSTFVLEVMMLWNARQFWKLAWYGVGTLVLGLLGVMLGKRFRGHVGVKEDNMPDWITVILLGFVEGITGILARVVNGALDRCVRLAWFESSFTGNI
ncbi:MAG UNVERIFIED_CONTAM: fluoride efflux transporter CrcB [Anaerolineae bacterium]|jgi:CrcB protein